MTGRSRQEVHRGATPLELFFDLCFVVAIALAANSLHHGLTANVLGESVLRYAIVFFGIWWAWVNFTWFASAFDTDDVPYRLATFVQIGGALILAAGVPRAFDQEESGITVLGYVVMRLALVAQWLRVAYSDPAHRPAALRFALGVGTLQVGWVLLLLAPDGVWRYAFVLGAIAELIVPVWAERATTTPWHPGHIGERYGLFTLIVLGECVLAATMAFQTAFDTGEQDLTLVSLAACALVIVCSMWWLYFDGNIGGALAREPVFLWSYGHYFVFASAAALGAGLAVSIDFATDHAELSELAAGYTVALPVAIFLLSAWLLHGLRRGEGGWRLLASAATVCLILLTPFTGVTVPLVACLLAVLIVIKVIVRGFEPSETDSVLMEE